MHNYHEMCNNCHEIFTRMYLYRSSYSLLFLAGVTAAEAWTGVAAPVTQLGLHGSHRSYSMQGPAMVLGTSSSLRLDRRALLEFVGKAAVAPVVVGVAFPREAAAESLSKDTAAAVGKLPLETFVDTFQSWLKATATGKEDKLPLETVGNTLEGYAQSWLKTTGTGNEDDSNRKPNVSPSYYQSLKAMDSIDLKKLQPSSSTPAAQAEAAEKAVTKKLKESFAAKDQKADPVADANSK